MNCLTTIKESESAMCNVDDDLSIIELAQHLHNVDEALILRKHGYTKQKEICETLQGDLFVALKNDQRFAIKRIPKQLHSKREAVQDGFHFIVDENILKEALILKHLTYDNRSIGSSVVQYVDFFESEIHFYLVTEYVESDISLKCFVNRAHQHIQNGKLDLHTYQNVIRYLLWQLIATLNWLHNDMKCCHLDLVPENIMLENGEFIEHSDGSISTNPLIGIKIVDFGASELFKPVETGTDGSISCNFRCAKKHISIENEQYLAPNIRKQNYYDARYADTWSYGMILAYCMFGEYPFHLIQETYFNEPLIDCNGMNGGYWCIHKGKLQQFLKIHNLLKFVNPKIFSLLNGLLNVDEKKRLNAEKVLKHKWFAVYYRKYCSQIKKKSKLQKKELFNQSEKMSHFPYYNLSITSI